MAIHSLHQRSAHSAQRFGIWLVTLLGIPCCAPTQADDITLLSVTRNGLQALMDICYTYSCKWRFKFSVKKSTVVVFNENMKSYELSERTWFLGAQNVKEDSSYTHLGIKVNKTSNSTQQINDICRKLKATYFSTTNIGAFDGVMHPLSSAIVYKSVVLQRALYGSETL